MISSLNELRRARALVEEAKDELRAAGQPFAEHCKLGIMVEVPSVALLADHFAGEVDFFSLGTNDMTQYALAVDRGMSKVAWLYDPFHPAVLRLIEMVADSGQRTNTPVSICGEDGQRPLGHDALTRARAGLSESEPWSYPGSQGSHSRARRGKGTADRRRMFGHGHRS